MRVSRPSMTDENAQNQDFATIKIPKIALNNRMSASTHCYRNSHFDELPIADQPVALAGTNSSGISTDTLARHTPTQTLKTLSIGPSRARAIFSSESLIIPDLGRRLSRGVEISWTSRSQNLKL